MMTIEKFKREGPASRHAFYDRCVLSPVAPEYTVGDVLLAATYRELILGVRDSEIDLGKLAALPSRMGDVDAWRHILQRALKAPTRARQTGDDDVIPIVPRLGAHGSVLGAPRNRWQPGTLVAAALGGDSAGQSANFLSEVAAMLGVDSSDDIAARFLESELVQRDGAQTGSAPLGNPPPPSFWRSNKAGPLTPGERLARDVQALATVKQVLPRYQWSVLFQAILRLGVSSYQLWLCMLHVLLWERLWDIVDAGAQPPSSDEIEGTWCTNHASIGPLLELGENATEAIKTQTSRYAVARTGINLVLHALEDAGAPWNTKLGHEANGWTPSESIAAFAAHVAANAAPLREALVAGGLDQKLRRAGEAMADRNATYVSGESGTTKNLREFLRYALGQSSRRRDEFETVDQAYFTRARNRSPNAPQIVRPGPTMLVTLAVCTAQGGEALPASMQDLAAHLRDYGVYSPLGTLTDGELGRELEELGLTVETPDAGGGRLLVNPFSTAATGAHR